MRWIDTHCHLDAPEFGTTIQAQRALAASNGVVHCVIPAIAVDNFAAVRAMAHQSGDSYCLGITPMNVPYASVDALSCLTAAVKQYHADPRLVAIGEIGLDYFVPELCKSPWRERQHDFFYAQLKLARAYDLPVVVHSRRSVDQILKALRQVAGPGGQWHGVVHAFNGSFQQALAFIQLGFKLGFGGALTYERARHLRSLATGLPLEAIVLETDSPDMPPRWLYKSAEQRATGEPQGINSPAEVPRIGAELAQLRGISLQALADATTRNALQAFARLRALVADTTASEAMQEEKDTP
ncbi:TatD family hydrolase [Rhodoferax antarcticus]|uniref:TatD-related deoxyribonuclease n=1 Tax=Rhodoferax antarcticus ANT.BR TaxID=1111071 RepID=A0A1Q8YAW6_9BURK|nr:TatD family hydrolase [Rhodoferax antarcticus]APW47201.1 DNAase [Rhodoferax antarcticus]OLP05132.1 TatD-related deoxyribonuclease [Rhodoferax antarcticus ANT.BR]